VQVRVRAVNSIGTGLFSQLNTAADEQELRASSIETEPDEVVGLQFDPVISSVTQLAISWPHLQTHEQTGGSPVLNYKIRFNQGSLINRWVDIDIIPASPVLNYLIVGLSPGEDYQIAIQAENIHGFSKNSAANIFTERAASQPN